MKLWLLLWVYLKKESLSLCCAGYKRRSIDTLQHKPLLRITGKVSGVDITPSSGMPGASSQITIRGVRSFTGDNTPLYVIDGMPISSAADIDTDTRNTGSVAGADFANRGCRHRPERISKV